MGAPTAFFNASIPQGYEAATDLLLKRGASVEARDAEGDTALHYALQRTDLPKGPNHGLTQPERDELRQAQGAKRLRLLAMLLDAAERRQAGGAARLANMQAYSGSSCLHLAAHNVSRDKTLVQAAQLLLERGADTG